MKRKKTTARKSSDKRLIQLAERDGYKCGICKHSMDAEFAKLEAFYWQSGLGQKNTVRRKHIDISIDHIVPKHLFNKGINLKHLGNIPANLQIAHRGCNSKKGKTCTVWDWLKFLRNLFR